MVDARSATTGRRPAGRSRRRVPLGVAVVLVLGAELWLAAPVLREALRAIRHAHLSWLAVAVVAEAFSMDVFARLRRRLLAAAGLHARHRDTVAAVYAANALHLTMPGGAAFSTAYVYRWLRARGAGGAAGSWVLVAGGLVSTSTLAALAVAGSLLLGATAGLLALGADLALVAALVGALRVLHRRPELWLVTGRRLLRRTNSLLRRPPDSRVTDLERWTAQLAAVRPSAGDWTAAVAYGIGNWILDAGCLAAACAAVGTRGLTLPVLLIAYTAGMAAAGISLLPGGIGVVDTAMVLAMVAGGVPAAAALPAVLLYRLISLVAVAAAGWLVAAVRARGDRARSARSRSAARDRPTG